MIAYQRKNKFKELFKYAELEKVYISNLVKKISNNRIGGVTAK